MGSIAGGKLVHSTSLGWHFFPYKTIVVDYFNPFLETFWFVNILYTAASREKSKNEAGEDYTQYDDNYLQHNDYAYYEDYQGMSFSI